MNILGATEEYQIQQKITDVMFSSQKDDFLKRLIDEGFDISKDELRDMFESELANRKTLKQDYTPESICKLLSLLCGHSEEILDVCCGVGSLSLPHASGNTRFFMEEISDMSLSLLLINMCIRGTSADIYKKDVLTKEVYKHYRLVKNDNGFSDVELLENEADTERQYECIVSNPPYSLKWEPLNDERFRNYGLAPKSKADYAFVLDILYRLKDDGKAFIILPHGVLFRGQSEGAIRKALIHDNVIDCVIGLPGNMFMNTSIPTVVLGLKKNKMNKDVLFIDASKTCKKTGKYNILTEEQISKIIDAYNSRKDVNKFSKLVSLEEIESNDFNLNIPRYVDTFEEKEPIDIEKNLKKLIRIEYDIKQTETELAKMLKDLNGPSEYIQYRDGLIDILDSDETMHAFSNMCDSINQWISTSSNKLMIQKQVNIYDVADFERSKKGKEYDEGSVLIQVSASKGQLVYLDRKQTVDSKYGVFLPKNINSKYLYCILEMMMTNFLKRYQTGLNINPEIFKHLNITIHPDKTTQAVIVYILESIQSGIDVSVRKYEEIKDVKQYHLDNMFI